MWGDALFAGSASFIGPNEREGIQSLKALCIGLYSSSCSLRKALFTPSGRDKWGTNR